MRPIAEVLKELELFDDDDTESVLRLTESLVKHKLYQSVTSLERACRFMEYQVWCVWDFMNLGKSIQTKLGSYSIPWLPPTRTDLLNAINGIMEEEESDKGPDAKPASHLEIFLHAMHEAGANTLVIDAFIAELRQGVPYNEALDRPLIPSAARTFAMTTMELARKPLFCRVACFCLTREELVPRMFAEFVKHLDRGNTKLSAFLWYLERHVDLDTTKHAPLTRFLLKEVIGTDVEKRKEAGRVVQAALVARRQYLDATLQHVVSTAA